MPKIFRLNLLTPLLSVKYRNAALVYLGYSFRFLSPLILYPLLTRRLGAQAFGVYVSAYSLALMLSVITEYGFNLSGTRDIATANDASTRGKIASRIVTARLLLTPIALMLGACLTWANPVLRDHPLAAALAATLGCAQGSTAFWYFQGIGKIYVAVFLEIFGQIAALILTFITVKSHSDLLLAVFIQSALYVTSAFAGILVMFREAPFVRTSIREAAQTLASGFAIFLSRTAVMIYSSASVFILAGLAGPIQAALYGAAERITGAAIALLRPLSSITLPSLARAMVRSQGEAIQSAKKILLLAGAAYAALCIACILFSPIAVPLFFGIDFNPAVPVLQILATSLPLVALNSILGGQVMVVMRLDREIAISALSGAAVNIILALPAAYVFGAVGMALSRTASEATILGVYSLCVSRNIKQNSGKINNDR